MDRISQILKPTKDDCVSGGSSEEATEAVPPQIKLNKKKIKNIIFN
jgi:hypothetical protein